MASGSTNLTYGLFSDSGATNPVGSNFWPAGGGNPIIADFPLLIGTDTKTANLYGRVYSGQQTAPAGAYSTSFGTSDAVIQYGLLSLISCDLLTARDRTTFTASASVSTNCSVTASNLNFGALGVLNAAVDGSTTISPVCTNGAPYTIGLKAALTHAPVSTTK